MESLTETFCLFDDFCKQFEEKWKKSLIARGERKRLRETGCLNAKFPRDSALVVPLLSNG